MGHRPITTQVDKPTKALFKRWFSRYQTQEEAKHLANASAVLRRVVILSALAVRGRGSLARLAPPLAHSARQDSPFTWRLRCFGAPPRSLRLSRGPITARKTLVSGALLGNLPDGLRAPVGHFACVPVGRFPRARRTAAAQVYTDPFRLDDSCDGLSHRYRRDLRRCFLANCRSTSASTLMRCLQCELAA